MRHTHTIMLIDGKTGDIIWTLGGKRNDFTELDPPEGVNPLASLLSMGWQHHARYIPNTNETEMTFFDNHVKITSHGKCRYDCSRGLHIAINDAASPPTVQLLREFHHPSQLQAQSQGNVQVLSAEDGDIGNVFIGWGRCPSFTEHSPSGETVMDVQFSPWHSFKIPDAVDNYRAYKMDWTATPWWDPAIALIETSETELDIYVSWNGATEVHEWVVRGTREDDADALALSRSPRSGFETKFTVEREGLLYLWAEAVDVDGNVIRSTSVWSVAGNITVISESVDPVTYYLPTVHDDDSSIQPMTWVLLGAGVVVLVALGTVVGIIFWRRRRLYDALEDDDLDLDSDGDFSTVAGLEDLEYEPKAEDTNNEESEALIGKET
jgi:Arylsulfotransferase (ASST)